MCGRIGVSVADINAQLGTGSTDFMLNGMYNIRVENFGVNASVSYKINTVNSQHYKYRDKFSSNLIAYYRPGAKKLGISPNAGIGYENITSNLLSSKKIQYTGSNVTNVIIGVEFSVCKMVSDLTPSCPSRKTLRRAKHN